MLSKKEEKTYRKVFSMMQQKGSIDAVLETLSSYETVMLFSGPLAFIFLVVLLVLEVGVLTVVTLAIAIIVLVFKIQMWIFRMKDCAKKIRKEILQNGKMHENLQYEEYDDYEDNKLK